MSCNKERIFTFKINFRRKTFILEMSFISFHSVPDNVQKCHFTYYVRQTQANEGVGDLKKLLHVQKYPIKVTLFIFRFKDESKLLLISVHFVELFIKIIEVALGNEITQYSSVQFNSMLYVYYIACSPL